MQGLGSKLGLALVAAALGGCFPDYSVGEQEPGYYWDWVTWRNQATFNHPAVIDDDEVTVGEFKAWFDTQKLPTPGPLDANIPSMVWDASWEEDALQPPPENCMGGPNGDLPSTWVLVNQQKMAPELPITCVNWAQAVAYCASHGKRLPTVSEWLFLRTSPGPGAFPWGNAVPTNCDQATINIPDGSWCGFPKVIRSAGGDMMGGRADMIGSVFEWVWDARWEADPVYPDYAGPSTIDRDARRYRVGGAFVSPPESQLLIDGFEDYGAREKFNDAGFRCATPTP